MSNSCARLAVLRTGALPVFALILVGCARPTPVGAPAPLAIDISELCTRCVEVLRCDGAQGNRVYVLEEKSTWAQIATIGDYFLQYIRPKREDFRDVRIYDAGAESTRLLDARERGARLDVATRRIGLPDGIIVQEDGAWLDVGGKVRGTCVHVPRGEDRALAKRLATQGG